MTAIPALAFDIFTLGRLNRVLYSGVRMHIAKGEAFANVRRDSLGLLLV